MSQAQTNIQAVPSTHQQTLGTLRNELRQVFYERNHIIDGALAALIAGEHILLLGPPGTAKSSLARVLCNAIQGANYFERLLGKGSVPEELFGPFKVSALKNDCFERKIDRKLPEAHIAFLDEIWKANTMVLNSLLRVANERVFDNDQVINVPLLSMFGASNELPESEELEALFDRFVFRYWVDSISDRDNLKAMLTSKDPTIATSIALADLEAMQKEAKQVKLEPGAMDVLLDVKVATERAGVRASDRRWKKVVKVLKAFAYVCGDTEVGEDHFDILPDVLWREPKERATLVQEVGKVANPMAAKASEVLDAAKELFRELPQTDGPDARPKAECLAAMAETNAEFERMESELQNSIQSNPNKARKLKEAADEVAKMHQEVQRQAAKLAGVRI